MPFEVLIRTENGDGNPVKLTRKNSFFDLGGNSKISLTAPGDETLRIGNVIPNKYSLRTEVNPIDPDHSSHRLEQNNRRIFWLKPVNCPVEISLAGAKYPKAIINYIDNKV